MSGAQHGGVVVEDFRARVQNTLRGFARVRFPSGLMIHEIALHVAGGRAWALPPSRPMVDRDGAVLRDRDRKTRWQLLITFADKNIRDNWSAQVVAAVHEAFPDALQDAVPGRAA
jgi:hypothetical protein